jgi:hypothetical protein
VLTTTRPPPKLRAGWIAPEDDIDGRTKQRRVQALAILLVFGLFAAAAVWSATTAPGPEGDTTSQATPTTHQFAIAASVGVDPIELTRLMNKQLYQMKPVEVGRYLAYLHAVEPDLRARVAHLARKNLGQPYELYLLGEFPYETTDAQPLLSLEKSDCVVFVEQTYAMALSQSWSEFFWMLQRIRYKDGIIGVTTRNHYTETDWNRQNAWLVNDVSAEVAGDRTTFYNLVVDRQKFFRTRYNLDESVPIENSRQAYVPKAVVNDIASQLQVGDFVNVISGKSDGTTDALWASHVGLVVAGPNGERHFLHSSEPAVREETFDSFIRRTTMREARDTVTGTPHNVLYGFKFLRLNTNPEVPPMAPQPRPRKR